MFSLLLLTGSNPKKSAVVDSSRVTLVDGGPKARVTWYNGKDYVAKLLKTDDNRQWLDSLTVLTTGDIVDEGLPHIAEPPNTNGGPTLSTPDSNSGPPDNATFTESTIPSHASSCSASTEKCKGELGCFQPYIENSENSARSAELNKSNEAASESSTAMKQNTNRAEHLEQPEGSESTLADVPGEKKLQMRTGPSPLSELLAKPSPSTPTYSRTTIGSPEPLDLSTFSKLETLLARQAATQIQPLTANLTSQAASLGSTSHRRIDLRESSTGESFGAAVSVSKGAKVAETVTGRCASVIDPCLQLINSSERLIKSCQSPEFLSYQLPSDSSTFSERTMPSHTSSCSAPTENCRDALDFFQSSTEDSEKSAGSAELKKFGERDSRSSASTSQYANGEKSIQHPERFKAALTDVAGEKNFQMIQGPSQSSPRFVKPSSSTVPYSGKSGSSEPPDLSPFATLETLPSRKAATPIQPVTAHLTSQAASLGSTSHRLTDLCESSTGESFEAAVSVHGRRPKVVQTVTSCCASAIAPSQQLMNSEQLIKSRQSPELVPSRPTAVVTPRASTSVSPGLSHSRAIPASWTNYPDRLVVSSEVSFANCVGGVTSNVRSVTELTELVTEWSVSMTQHVKPPMNCSEPVDKSRESLALGFSRSVNADASMALLVPVARPLQKPVNSSESAIRFSQSSQPSSGPSGVVKNCKPVVGALQQQISEPMVRLIPDTDVFIRSAALRRILRKVKNDWRAMIRQLLDELVGKESLRTMRATGKGGWPKIPEDILLAVEDYVITCSNGAVDHALFMKVVNKYLDYLRN